MRFVSGVILGYLIFAGSAFLLFRITGHDPHAPASISFEIGAIEQARQAAGEIAEELKSSAV